MKLFQQVANTGDDAYGKLLAAFCKTFSTVSARDQSGAVVLELISIIL